MGNLSPSIPFTHAEMNEIRQIWENFWNGHLRDIEIRWYPSQGFFARRFNRAPLSQGKVDKIDFENAEKIYSLNSECSKVADALNKQYPNLSGICTFSCDQVNAQNGTVIGLTRKYEKHGN